MAQYDNYIFDIYGTLINASNDEHSSESWTKWCMWLDDHNVLHPSWKTFHDDFFRLDKRNRKLLLDSGICSVPEIDIIEIYDELFTQYGNRQFSTDFLYECSYAFRVASRKYIKLYPGVIEYLCMLKDTGRRAYILSNAQLSYTWPEIEMFDLQKLTVDQIISSNHKCMKPDVRLFNHLISKHNLDLSRTVMIGDSADSDVAGAIAAEIDYILLQGDNSPDNFYVDNLFRLL